LPHQAVKAALLYGSSHGCTRKVVERSVPRFVVKPDVFNVKDTPVADELVRYDILLFFAPTYGDEELQPDMEQFIGRFTVNLEGKHFVICELGNYYGYDDFSFGAMRILRWHLIGLNGMELCSPLSLDSMPRVNWPHLYRWIEQVNRCFKGYVRL
jgi:hypothetical protein